MASICCIMPVALREWACKNYDTAMNLSSGKNKINWIATCSNNEDCGQIGLMDTIYAPLNKAVINNSCIEHAAAVTLAIRRLKPQKNSFDIVVILDSDMFILYKHWDEEIVSIMEQYDIFGGNFAPPPLHDQYQNFPSISLFVILSEVLFSKPVDIYPTFDPAGNPLARKILTYEEATLVGLNVGDRCSMDTSWKLPLTFRRDEYKVYGMPVVRGDSPEAFIQSGGHDKLRGVGFQEFHHNGKVFAAHLRGSRGIPINSPIAMEWLSQMSIHHEQ